MAKAKKESKKAKDNGILNAADLRAQTPDQLKDVVLSLKKEQFNARFQKLAGEAAKPSRTRAVRKNIARAKTVQSENRIKESANA